MKTVTIEKKGVSLSQIERMVSAGPVIVTRRGVPTFAAVKIDAFALEALSLGSNRDFMAMLAESWNEYRAKGGVTLAEARRILGVDKAAARRRRTASAAKRPRGA